MTKTRAGANGTGLTAERIMAEAQTYAMYLEGLLDAADMLYNECSEDQGLRIQNAIMALIAQSKAMAGQLIDDLDSIRLKAAAE